MPTKAKNRVPRSLLAGLCGMVLALIGLLTGVALGSLLIAALTGIGGILLGIVTLLWLFRGKRKPKKTESQGPKPTPLRGPKQVPSAAHLMGRDSPSEQWAVLATPELQGTLRAPQLALVPGIVRSQMEVAEPSGILIEEAALSAFPWQGTLEPGGGQMLNEVVSAINDVLARGGQAFLVPHPNGLTFGAQALRPLCRPISVPEVAALPTNIIKESQA